MAEDVKYTPTPYDPTAAANTRAQEVISQYPELFQSSSQSQLGNNLVPSPDPKSIPTKRVKISDDPSAPFIKVRADATNEQIAEILKSEQIEKQLYDQGFLYKYGLSAERYNAADDLNDTSVMKGLKGGWSGLKQIGAGALGTIADLLAMEELEEATNRAIQQYQLEGAASQYTINEETGKAEAFTTSIEEIMGSEDKLSEFIDWVGFNIGSGAATIIPIFAASVINPTLGIGAMYGMGIGDSRIAQLEARDFEGANAGLSLATGVFYAASERLFGAGAMLQKTLYKKFGKDAVKATVDKTLKQTTKGIIGREVLKTQASEALAEGSQNILTDSAGRIEKGLQPGESIKAELADLYTSKEFWKATGEAAASGAAGSGPFGIAGGVVKSVNIGKRKRKIDSLKIGESGVYVSNDELIEDAPEVEEYKGKTYTVPGVYDIKDEDGNQKRDENREVITPTYKVKGVVEKNGKKFAVLVRDQEGSGEQNILQPISDLSVLNELKSPIDLSKEQSINPKTGEVDSDDTPRAGQIYIDTNGDRVKVLDILEPGLKNGVTTKTIRTQNLDKPSRSVGTDSYDTFLGRVNGGSLTLEGARTNQDFIPYSRTLPVNKKTLNKSKKILKERGYPQSEIDRYDDYQIVEFAKDTRENENYVSEEEFSALDQLGYFKKSTRVVENKEGTIEILNEPTMGEAVVSGIKNNTNINPKTKKSYGREMLEDILNNKIYNDAKIIKTNEPTGEVVVTVPQEASAIQEAANARIINRKNQLNNKLNRATTEQERNEINTELKFLDDAIEVSEQNPESRLLTLNELSRTAFKGNQSDASPSAIRGLRNQIQATQNNPFISEEAKATELNFLNNLLNNAEANQTLWQKTIASFGLKPFTDSELEKISVNSYRGRGPLTTKVKGKTKKVTQKQVLSKFYKDNPDFKLTPAFENNEKGIYQMLRDRLDQLGLSFVGLNMEGKPLSEFLLNKMKEEGHKGNFLIHEDLVNMGLTFQNPQWISILSVNSIGGKQTFGREITSVESRLFMLHHEAMHALIENGFFTNKEITLFKKYAKENWINEYNIKERYPNLTEDQQLEEAMSDAFASHILRDKIYKGPVKQAFLKLEAYLIALSDTLFNTNYTKPEQIFEEISLGKRQKKRAQELVREVSKTIAVNRKRGTKMGLDPDDPSYIDYHFNQSQAFIDDPTDSKDNQRPKPKRSEVRDQQRRTANLIDQDKNTFTNKDNNTTNPNKFGFFQRIMGHARIWAKEHPIFTPLWLAVYNKNLKTKELQTQYVDKLSEVFTTVIQKQEYKILLEKAFEISQQVVGRYRKDADGRIIFRAERDGDGASSTVKAGDVVVLEGDIATAYEDVQLAIQLQHAEIIKGMLAGGNSLPLLNDVLDLMAEFVPQPDAKIFINGTKSINEMTKEDYENLTSGDIDAMVDILQGIQNLSLSTDIQNINGLPLTEARRKELSARISTMLGRLDETKDEQFKVGSGLLALNFELKKYDEFLKTDYIPLQRYGDKFITVKNKTTGEVVDYRMFNKGKYFDKFMNEENEVRQDLNKKYGDSNEFIISDTKQVSLNRLKQNRIADLASIDSAAQSMSDVNVNAYLEIRKELNTILNKGSSAGQPVVGFSSFIAPRKKQGGVPGFSTDFVRGISQYGQASSTFAAGNRFNKSISDSFIKSQQDDVIDSEGNSVDPMLQKSIKKWYDYVNDPKQEYAAIRRMGFWYFLGGNVSSALLQLMSIVQFVGPTISTLSGNKQSAVVELGKAFKEVMAMMDFSGDRKFQDVFLDFSKLPDDIKEDAKLDIMNGIIKQGMALHETGMPTGAGIRGARDTNRDKFRMVENTIIGGMFNTMETVARLSAYIATYRMMKDPKSIQNATDHYSSDRDFIANVNANNGVVTPRIVAQQMIEENFGVYGKEQRPELMRGIGSVFLLFQTYISQMFSLMGRLLTRSGSPAQRAIGRKILAKQMVMILSTGGLFGLPFGDDLAWLMEMMLKTFPGLDIDIRNETKKMLSASIGPRATELFTDGVFNAALGIDVQRRLSFGNIPGSQQIRAALGLAGFNTGTTPDAIFGAPGAILFQNARKMFRDYDQTGEFPWSATVHTALPTFLSNALKGGQMALSGKAESGYGTTISSNITALESLAKMAGFNPTKLSKEREVLFLERKNSGRNSIRQKRVNNKIKNTFRELLVGIQEDNRDAQFDAQNELNKIMLELFDYNSKQKPKNLLTVDTYRLLQEAFSDINKEVRYAKSGYFNFVDTIADREARGLQ
tara:strand:- start:63 stop:6830 length:6768 start_codon:yes stop_codon:yes gene_type:complete